jgi:hypothetical protein
MSDYDDDYDLPYDPNDLLKREDIKQEITHTHEKWVKIEEQRSRLELKKLEDMKNEILITDYRKIVNINNLLIGLIKCDHNVISIILDYIIIEQIPLYVVETVGMYDGNTYELNSIHFNKNDVNTIVDDPNTLDYRDDGKVRIFILNSKVNPFQIIKFNYKGKTEITKHGVKETKIQDEQDGDDEQE